MADDPNSLYEYSQAGVPQGYTSNLQSLGYVPQPFATQEQVFQNQGSFQQLLKRILDSQLQGYDQYGVNPENLAALPWNMRGMYNQAALAFKDPMYGLIGNNAFFGGGYKLGGLPNNRSHAYETWYNAAHNYPNIPAPNPVTSGSSSNSGGGGNSGGGTRQYTVAIPGGGSYTVNASSEAAARENVGANPNERVEQGGYRF